MITQYDHLVTHCPMLGHSVNFSYCRSTDGNTPCRRIFNCWYQRFAVQDFVYDHYAQEIITTIIVPPKPKMMSLIELIQKAQQSKKNGGISHKDVKRW